MEYSVQVEGLRDWARTGHFVNQACTAFTGNNLFIVIIVIPQGFVLEVTYSFSFTGLLELLY